MDRPIWRPSPERVAEANLTAFMARLRAEGLADIADYPALQWYVMVGGKADLGRGWRLTLGITENLLDQQSTIDAGLWSSLEVLF